MDPKEIVQNMPQEQAEPPKANSAPLSGRPADSCAPSRKGRIENWAPAEGLRVSKEEYWEKWYEHPHPHIDVSYEWNNGILEAKPPPNYVQTNQYRWFVNLLGCYVEVHPIAKIICMETGVSMTVQDASEPSGKWEVVYKPDIAVVLNDNPAPWGATELRAFEGVIDVAVEVVSDSTSAEVRRDTQNKRAGYARAGVREYFVLDPSDRHMHFFRPAADGRYQEIQPDVEGVIRSQVLPGFQFRREDLLRLPAQAELARDEVYAGYVIPELQVAETRAGRAEEQAEAEAQRAAAEVQRADAEAKRAAAEAQRADAEAAARRAAEDELQALRAEVTRLRQQRS